MQSHPQDRMRITAPAHVRRYASGTTPRSTRLTDPRSVLVAAKITGEHAERQADKHGSKQYHSSLAVVTSTASDPRLIVRREVGGQGIELQSGGPILRTPALTAWYQRSEVCPFTGTQRSDIPAQIRKRLRPGYSRLVTRRPERDTNLDSLPGDHERTVKRNHGARLCLRPPRSI
jgi:hypothetical protein